MGAKSLDKIHEANKFFAAVLGVDPLPLDVKDEFVQDKNGTIFAQLQTIFNIPKLIRIFGFTGRSEDSIISSIAHEVMHQYQFQTGKLKVTIGGKYYWNDEENKENYLNQPWEIEARQFQNQKIIEFNRWLRENAQNSY